MRCRACGHDNSEDAGFCCQCGARLEPDEKEKRFCANCGAEVEGSFCSKCGAPVTEKSTVSSEEIPEIREEAKHYCKNCGAELDGQFCSNCGTPAGSGEMEKGRTESTQKTQNTQKIVVQKEADESVKKSKKTLLLMIVIAAVLVIVELLTLTIGGEGPKGNPILKFFVFTYLIGGLALLVIGGIMSVRAFSLNNTALCTMNETYENGVDLGITTNDELEQRICSMQLNTGRYVARGKDGTVVVEGPRSRHNLYVENGLVKMDLPYFQYRLSTIWRTINEWRIPAQIRKSIEANHIMDEIVSRVKPELLPDASRYEKCKPRGDKMISSLGLAFCGIIMFLVFALYIVTYNGNAVSYESIKDAYDVAGMTEEEFLEKTGYTKNEYGCYPNEDEVIFSFADGELSMISLFEDFGDEYSFKGISIGDKYSENIDGFSKLYDLQGGENRTAHHFRDDSHPNYILLIKSNEDGTINSIGYMYMEDEMWQEIDAGADWLNEQSVDAESEEETQEEKDNTDLYTMNGLYAGRYELDYPITTGYGTATIEESGNGFYMSLYYYNADDNEEYRCDTYLTDKGNGTSYYGDAENGDIEFNVEVEEHGIYVGSSSVNNEYYNILYPMSGTYTYVGAEDSTTSYDNRGEYLLPDADTRYYSREEIEQLGSDNLRLARNEILARHGRIFESEDLYSYYSSKSWYRPQYTADEFDPQMDQILNAYEKANIETIKAIENGAG